MEEKRGPIEKGEKGWPINPFGVVILLIFALIAVFLIIKPLFSQKVVKESKENLITGQIVTPQAGEIVKSQILPIELSVDDPSKVAKVQFWARAYVDNKWEIIGEVAQAPFKFDWNIPPNYQNKAIVITSHVYDKNGAVTKDPGGWREGIIIFSQ